MNFFEFNLSSKLSGNEWIPEECCSKVLKYDSRTPGLFKEEFSGIGMISLNSKTYFCWSSDENVKYSSKGLSKKTNKLSKDDFLSVLQTRKSVCGINKGFVHKNNVTYSYEQKRTGLTYMYAKRKICQDGTSTQPIDA